MTSVLDCGQLNQVLVASSATQYVCQQEHQPTRASKMDLFKNGSPANLFEYLTVEIHVWEVIRDENDNIKTWRLYYANPPALKSWGFQSLEDIKGKITDELFGSGAAEHYMPIVEKVFAENKPHSYRDYFENLGKHFRFTTIPYGEYFITTGDDITEFVENEELLRNTNIDLQALIKERNERLQIKEEEIRSLRGVIPICSYCHNIRNDEGAWDRLEEYIARHTDAQFSHGVCPQCFTKVCGEDLDM